jgi:uncharacterized protein (DUF427 family)
VAKAIWNGKIIAESERTESVEGNHYFPAESVRKEFLKESDHQSVCPWKGTAGYYHVVVEGQVNENAAWYYPAPKKAAEHIRGHVAFWKGVRVEE